MKMMRKIALSVLLAATGLAILGCGQEGDRQRAENLCIETNAALGMLVPELNQAEGSREEMARVLTSAGVVMQKTALRGKQIQFNSPYWTGWQLSVGKLARAYRQAGWTLKSGEEQAARRELRAIKALQAAAGRQAEAAGLKGCPPQGGRP